MSQADKPESKQEKAIHNYLESLLYEVDDAASEQHTESVTLENQKSNTQSEAEPPPVEVKTSPSVIGLEKLVAEIPDVITQTVTETETKVIEKTELDVQVSTAVEPQTEVASGEIDSAVPDWAQSRFQCLLFKVSGLSLAVPLVKLNSVIPWNEEITKTPNQTEWYLGLVQHLKKQVKIIDTALLVMPENRHEKIQSEPEERLSHILLVDDYKWGLACDSIGDVIWLTKDEVKWRKNKSSRAWLSGTSLEHLCAIMDTEVFAQMLVDSSQSG